MANFQATLAALRLTTPQSLAKGNQQDGEKRVFRSTYTAPAASPPQIADVLQWGYLPKGAVVLSFYLTYGAAGAGCTINLGDVQSAARYMAATSIAAAGNTGPSVPANLGSGGAAYEVAAPNPGATTDDSEIRSVVAGAAIAVNTVINLVLEYVQNN